MDSFEINKIITAVFLVVFVVFGVGKISDVIFKVKKPDIEGYKVEAKVGTETATNTTAVVVKTTSALTNFAPGDVLHDEDDQVIGTVKSVTDATNIVLTKNCQSVSAVNKDLYNIHPIQLMLSGSI